jgi:hypothetical protein
MREQISPWADESLEDGDVLETSVFRTQPRCPLLTALLLILCGVVPADAGIACPVIRGASTLAVTSWRPPADAPHGVHAFTNTTDIVLPPGVESLRVEIWGGGGGGGGGADDSFSEGGAGGGGGASGAYVRGNLLVPPGAAFRLVVGSGGVGGDKGQDGRDGAPSAVCVNDVAVLLASGGRGGLGASSGHGGAGGRAQGADAEDGDAFKRPGRSGGAGSEPLFRFGGAGGAGGASILGTLQPSGSSGGIGGAGGMRPQPASRGTDGGPGFIVVTW